MRRVPIWLIAFILLVGAPVARGQQNPGASAPGNADRFAAVALEPLPQRRGPLAENPPPVLPAVELDAAQSNPSLDFPARRVMRTRAEFETAYQALIDRARAAGSPGVSANGR
jgi:hypothetical protein